MFLVIIQIKGTCKNTFYYVNAFSNENIISTLLGMALVSFSFFETLRSVVVTVCSYLIEVTSVCVS